ncbi:MAG: mechanosensitive ion channel family protein [Chlamydiia bacterium]|nr:mechanosensitive ion channel family protein [Chlamydiia bacterium]
MDSAYNLVFSSRLLLSAFVFLLSVIFAWVVRRILRVVSEKAVQNPWIHSLCEALRGPILWLLAGLGALTAAEVYFDSAGLETQHELLLRGRSVYVVMAVTWLLFQWKAALEILLIERVETRGVSRSEKALIMAFMRLFSIAVFSVAGFMVLDIFGVPLSALVAFGSVAALGISWAAKDVVANFFGGLMIFINRPFTVGDWIKSTNKNFEGVVEHIGWYMTQIRSFERRPTYIPNSLITDAIIENPGRMYNRRIRFDLGLRYEDIEVCKAVRDDIEAMLMSHRDIDTRQLLIVHFLDYGPYCLNINV